MNGLGQYSKTDAVFKTHWGTHIWFRTSTDPDSVVGIARVQAVWGDEAGKYSLYFWENIQGRASPMNAPILLTTSPYTLNWIYKDLIKPHRDGKRPEVMLIQAKSVENPYFNKDAYELARATMDPRRFNMMYGGEWGRMEGLVYNCWDADVNLVKPFRLPPGTRFVGGIDWGYNPDPFVYVVRAITPEGEHFQVSEFYKTGLTITDCIKHMKQQAQVWGIQVSYCGKDQPGYVEECRRHGVSVIPADNDIARGVDAHYELIKTRRYKIFEGTSPYTLDELDTYHYPEPKDLQPDQSAKPQTPVGQNDHCLDANRYVTISTHRSQMRTSPYTPGDERTTETQEARLVRLKRFSRNRHTENWS